MSFPEKYLESLGLLQRDPVLLGRVLAELARAGFLKEHASPKDSHRDTYDFMMFCAQYRYELALREPEGQARDFLHHLAVKYAEAAMTIAEVLPDPDRTTWARKCADVARGDLGGTLTQLFTRNISMEPMGRGVGPVMVHDSIEVDLNREPPERFSRSCLYCDAEITGTLPFPRHVLCSDCQEKGRAIENCRSCGAVVVRSSNCPSHLRTICADCAERTPGMRQ